MRQTPGPYKRGLAVPVLLAFWLAQPCVAADPSEFLVWSTPQLPGRLYVPSGYNPAQQYPLILFLHGFGERGTNNTAQVNGNIEKTHPNREPRPFCKYLDP